MLGDGITQRDGTISIRATRPWQTADAVAIVRAKMTETPQKQIDRCLNCKEPECWDCPASRRKKRGTS